MKKLVRLSLEERIEIEKFLNQGMSFRAISLKIDRSVTCINHEVNKNGGRSNYHANSAHDRYLSVLKNRNENMIKEETKIKLDQIPTLLQEGWSLNKIKYYIGISHDTLSKFMLQNNIKIPQKLSLEERISCLESQIEIIISQLRKK